MRDIPATLHMLVASAYFKYSPEIGAASGKYDLVGFNIHAFAR